MNENISSATEKSKIAVYNKDNRTGLEILEELLLKRRMIGPESLSNINDEFKSKIRDELIKEIKEEIDHQKSIAPSVTVETTDSIRIDACGINTDEYKLVLHIESPCPCVFIVVGGLHFAIPKDHFRNYPRPKQILKFYRYLYKKGDFYLLNHVYMKPSPIPDLVKKFMYNERG